MLQSFKAILDNHGQLHLLENIKMPPRARVIVTFVDETMLDRESMANSLLSEESLAKEWLSPEEEEAWKHLQ
jgi:hypothetical protein